MSEVHPDGYGITLRCSVTRASSSQGQLWAYPCIIMVIKGNAAATSPAYGAVRSGSVRCTCKNQLATAAAAAAAAASLLAPLQVWYTAATAPAGRSGSVRSSVKANAGPAKGQLRIAGLVIAGVPPQVDNAAPTASIAGQDVALAATYDAVTGVVRIDDIDLEVGQPFELNWSI
jgi:hypothetical protein